LVAGRSGFSFLSRFAALGLRAVLIIQDYLLEAAAPPGETLPSGPGRHCTRACCATGLLCGAVLAARRASAAGGSPAT
jgi:hypothetical protein